MQPVNYSYPQNGSPWWAWFGGICGCIVCIGFTIWLVILTVNQGHFITADDLPAVQSVGAVIGAGVASAAGFAAAAKSSAANSAAALQSAVGRRGGGNNAANVAAARWARAGAKKNK